MKDEDKNLILEKILFDCNSEKISDLDEYTKTCWADGNLILHSRNFGLDSMKAIVWFESYFNVNLKHLKERA